MHFLIIDCCFSGKIPSGRTPDAGITAGSDDSAGTA